jgi:hypothetical protein
MKNKYIVINQTTAKEINRIFSRYIEKYGNITISDLLIKLKTDCLILN